MSTITAPSRTLEQRRQALQLANRIRSRRSVLKVDLKAGRVSPRELLLNPPEYVETMKVVALLMAVPKFGRVKVNRTLARCCVSPSKTIGGMSSRQRAELVSLLWGWG